ncbi:hypothetical protein D3C73_1529420 [compost metagenome]
MDLQQVDLVSAQAFQGTRPLCLGVGPAVGRDFGGYEALLVPASLLQQLAKNTVCPAIVGRGVDNFAAAFEERLQYGL